MSGTKMDGRNLQDCFDKSEGAAARGELTHLDHSTDLVLDMWLDFTRK